MSRRIHASGALALLIALASLAQAQTAASPARAASAAAAAPARAAPAPADAGAAQGKVAYYGHKFAGRKTASGERFDPNALTMAHKTLPFGTLVRVTNVKNKQSVVVRVNDRGPTQADRFGDLSAAAARRIGMTRSGVVEASFETVGKANSPRRRAAKA